ncbi:hypothetical protein DMH17_14030 [Raoultella planticola]|nr:hypothetical protein [Raoultella planticola]
MEKASQALEFEEAARIRDQIQAVRRVTEKQFVSNTGDDSTLSASPLMRVWPASTFCLFVRARSSVVAAIFRKCRAVLSSAKWWRRSSVSSICRAARCVLCRRDSARF